MERVTTLRAIALLLIFCALVGIFGFRLYDLQIVSMDGKTSNLTTYETRTRVKAARGNIMDTNGNVLVC